MDNFLEIPRGRIIYEDDFFFIIKDLFPVSPGHLLIISRALKQDYFELSDEERARLNNAIVKGKELIELEYRPDGYNIGMNCGTTAGQTVFHFHCHLIPRYSGDMKDPAGGVRHCIVGKGYYR